MTLHEIADFLQLCVDLKTIDGECEQYPEYLRAYADAVDELVNELDLKNCMAWDTSKWLRIANARAKVLAMKGDG